MVGADLKTSFFQISVILVVSFDTVKRIVPLSSRKERSLSLDGGLKQI